ncbi:MAG: hypothetical protein AMJ81_04345 [Phycisphaerae bacterium SM23_33]|nr:MAG: hypothetical protein AMJ81_04345 [Phycisphaerae bacterium SM23_33]
MSEISRRDFLKGTIGLGAAASLPFIFVRSSPAAWAPATRVHPNIDDLRVVGLTDPKMTKEIQTRINWAAQERLVEADVVAADMDKLACALAKVKEPAEAWKAVFVKPPKKSWAETVVAIKTNHIHLQHTHSPVMAKMCRVFTDVLGVKGANVHIYDACHGRNIAKDTPFAGLPEGCRIEGQWGGSTVPTPVGEPYSGKTARCVEALTDASVDILVNIALCKGHGGQFGRFTMAMKNHLGTFEPGPAHREGVDYLVGINRTPEILGPMDKKTGKVLYPRQQLCLIDAIWASDPGPGGHPTHQPNFLAMGVLAPVVDYVLATRFRSEKMGWRLNAEATTRMLTSFGYKAEDLPEGGKIIPA